MARQRAGVCNRQPAHAVITECRGRSCYKRPFASLCVGVEARGAFRVSGSLNFRLVLLCACMCERKGAAPIISIRKTTLRRFSLGLGKPTEIIFFSVFMFLQLFKNSSQGLIQCSSFCTSLPSRISLTVEFQAADRKAVNVKYMRLFEATFTNIAWPSGNYWDHRGFVPLHESSQIFSHPSYSDCCRCLVVLAVVSQPLVRPGWLLVKPKKTSTKLQLNLRAKHFLHSIFFFFMRMRNTYIYFFSRGKFFL